MNCEATGCCEQAVCGVAIQIHASDLPEGHRPFQIVLGLRLCERHATKLDARGFLLGNPALINTVIMLTDGAGTPDFNTAVAVAVPFNSKLWQGIANAKEI